MLSQRFRFIPITRLSRIPGDFKTLVKAQVENPVKWQTIVENMINDGVDTFIEVGVGKTLTGLVKRINGDVKAFKVETAADIDALEL